MIQFFEKFEWFEKFHEEQARIRTLRYAYFYKFMRKEYQIFDVEQWKNQPPAKMIGYTNQNDFEKY